MSLLDSGKNGSCQFTSTDDHNKSQLEMTPKYDEDLVQTTLGIANEENNGSSFFF